jgi:hypothetical protein
MPEKPGFGGYIDTGVVRPKKKLATRTLSLSYNGLPTYSNNDLHIFKKNIIFIHSISSLHKIKS